MSKPLFEEPVPRRTFFRRLPAFGLGLGLAISGKAAAARDAEGVFGKALEETARYLRDAGFRQGYVDSLLAHPDLRYYPDIPGKFTKPPERLPYEKYKALLLTRERIEDGVAFMKKHGEALEQAEREHGVDRHVLASVLGLESSYGAVVGKYSPVGAFLTIVKDVPRRKQWALGQLKHLLEYCTRTGIDPFALRSSYAGAIGFPQFIPSSLVAFALTPPRQLNPHDAGDSLHLIGRYLKAGGWSQARPDSSASNRNALFSYNGSNNYVKAVLELAGLLKRRNAAE